MPAAAVARKVRRRNGRARGQPREEGGRKKFKGGRVLRWAVLFSMVGVKKGRACCVARAGFGVARADTNVHPPVEEKELQATAEARRSVVNAHRKADAKGCLYSNVLHSPIGV